MAIELYKHNKDAYERVIEHLAKSNKTCVIHPTGTGKSFISLKFLYDNRDKKCLFMCPTEAIVGQVKTHIENEGLSLDDFPNLDFCLYASANKIKNNKYDCIVFDEFHRIGADIWGTNVNEFLDNNKNSKVLGVSATPIRYLDDDRDMSKEIFDGDIASQMSLAEAIVKKILPVPNYISSVYSFQEDIDKIQKQIDNYKNKIEAKKYQKLLDEAKKMIKNSEGLEEVFGNNIQNKNGKFIVFCRNYEHMKEMEKKCREWFKNVNTNIEVSEVYAKQGKELNKYYIDYFENNKNSSLKLLFSIEMLNEGLHVNDIDGVVMFRPTESPIIYFQQLGRALSVGHNDNPLVFDIVNNYESIDSIISLKEEVEKLVKKIIKERNNGNIIPDYPPNDDLLKLLDNFKILEENKNIIDILDKLKDDTKFTPVQWVDSLKEYCETYQVWPTRAKTHVLKNGITSVQLANWLINSEYNKGEFIYSGITDGNGRLLKEILDELYEKYGNRVIIQIKNIQEYCETYQEWPNLSNKSKNNVLKDGTTSEQLANWLKNRAKYDYYKNTFAYADVMDETGRPIKEILDELYLKYGRVSLRSDESKIIWVKRIQEYCETYQEWPKNKQKNKKISDGTTSDQLSVWLSGSAKYDYNKNTFAYADVRDETGKPIKEILDELYLKYSKVSDYSDESKIIWVKRIQEYCETYQEWPNLSNKSKNNVLKDGTTSNQLATWLATSGYNKKFKYSEIKDETGRPIKEILDELYLKYGKTSNYSDESKIIWVKRIQEYCETYQEWPKHKQKNKKILDGTTSEQLARWLSGSAKYDYNKNTFAYADVMDETGKLIKEILDELYSKYALNKKNMNLKKQELINLKESLLNQKNNKKTL